MNSNDRDRNENNINPNVNPNGRPFTNAEQDAIEANATGTDSWPGENPNVILSPEAESETLHRVAAAAASTELDPVTSFEEAKQKAIDLIAGGGTAYGVMRNGEVDFGYGVTLASILSTRKDGDRLGISVHFGSK